jgi:hypothetical protein
LLKRPRASAESRRGRQALASGPKIVDMSEHINKIEGSPSPPPDVSLMLRAHAELRCLSREVIPVLRQLETREDLPEEQYGAAMAYLEVTWLQARNRAQETDAARRRLCGAADRARELADADLHGRACCYYDAVKELRCVAQARLMALMSAAQDAALCACEILPRAGT